MDYAGKIFGFVERHPITSLLIGISAGVGVYKMAHDGKPGKRNIIDLDYDTFNIVGYNQEIIKYLDISDGTDQKPEIENRDFNPQKDIGYC
jgi:hypothetical protein